jgi:hypothetical protein
VRPKSPCASCAALLWQIAPRRVGELSAAQIGHFQRSETTFSDISSSKSSKNDAQPHAAAGLPAHRATTISDGALMPPPPDGELSVLRTMAASSCASAAARLPCHPLDTIKSRLQVRNGWAAGGRSVRATLSTLLLAPSLAPSPHSAVRCPLHGACVQVVGVCQQAAAGLSSGGRSASTSAGGTSMIGVFRDVMRSEGVGGLYRGIGITLPGVSNPCACRRRQRWYCAPGNCSPPVGSIGLSVGAGAGR